MTNPLVAATPFGGLPAIAVPTACAAGALLTAACRNLPAAAWRAAETATAIAFVAAAATAAHAAAATSAPQAILLVFVAFLGVVLVRYSRSFLAGDRGEGSFAAWLLATLAGATTVLAAGNLLALSLAWVATSLALQQLLTFYRGRPLALVAAREKFLVSRTADFCMLTATALLGLRAGTLDLDALAAAGGRGELGDEGRVAVGFVAVAALLKCAQLPFHGWLLRVMEAPTPVSALLHAGVVNLGGFVLLRLSPLVDSAPIAQWLLVGVGGVTAAFAALAAGAQASVKSSLAWSTCAQMGFLMVQCGLGLFEMALLHLVAHSAYKAHAFLSAAGAVQRNAADALLAANAPPRLRARLLAAVLGAAVVAGTAAVVGSGLLETPALFVGSVILALGVSPLLVRGPQDPWLAMAWRGLVVAMLTATWLGLHDGLRLALGLTALPSAGWPLAAAAAVAMSPLPILRLLLAARPGSPLAARMQTLCRRGFCLDEWFTRLALRTWRHSPFVSTPAFVPELVSAQRPRGES